MHAAVLATGSAARVAKQGGVPLQRVYESVLLAESEQLRASILTLARFPDGTHESQSRHFLRYAGFSIGRDLRHVRWEFRRRFGAEAQPSWLRAALEEVAALTLQGGASSRANDESIGVIIDEIWHAPVVVLESSPAAGKSLSSVGSQLVAAYIVLRSGHPGLVIAYESSLIVIWFVAGPVAGAKEGLRRAAEETAYDVFKRWLEQRFGR